MIMKKEYIAPKATLIDIDTESIIATSGPEFGGNTGTEGITDCDAATYRNSLWD